MKKKTKTISVSSIMEVDKHITGVYNRIVKHCLLELGHGYAWKDGERIDFVMKG